MMMRQFWPVSYMRRRSASVIDGTQGSVDSGIVAAVFFTVSGGVATIVGQKNVASITRHAAGHYRINFNSALSDGNYGVLAQGRFADSSTDTPVLVQPNRNSSSGRNLYSTSSVDLLCISSGAVSGVEVVSCCVVIFDPQSVSADYLAAASWTVSGTTPSLQRQKNMGSISRHSAGVYRVNFSSALADADYSEFGTTRYGDFTDDAIAVWGQNRNTGIPSNLHSTASLDLCTGRLGWTTTVSNFDTARGSVLISKSNVAPRGTLARARFSVSGGVATLVSSWNVASVTYQATGCYRVNFTTPLIDADYGVICSGKFANFTDDNAPIIGPNRNSSASRNVYSANAVDIAARSTNGGNFDPDFVNVWVLKPWLM